MTPDEAIAFLQGHHRAILSTYRSDGRPQMSPVLVALDGDNRLVISTRETAVKTHNLRRDPRVAVCVVSDSFFGEWTQVEGTAEIVSLPGAMDPLIDYYRRANGEHSDWDHYRAAMERERRCVVRFAIERAGPTVAG